MKKQVALFGALAIVGFSAAPANALFFGDVFKKVTSVATNVVNKASGAVKGMGDKVLSAGKDLAMKGLDAVRSGADNVVTRLQTAAKDLASKGATAASKFMNEKAGWLKSKLPGFMTPFINKGLALGQGGLAKLHGVVNGAIDQAAKFAHGKVGTLAGHGAKIIAETTSKLKGAFHKAVDTGRGIIAGKIKRVSGQVEAHFNGVAKNLTAKVGGFFAKKH